LPLTWEFCPFEALSLVKLYKIMAARQEVFIVGQGLNCIDCDGDDLRAWHLAGWDEGELVAYLRVLPPGVRNEFFMIGRVLTRPHVRRLGYGKRIMQISEREIQKRWPSSSCTIAMDAQHYLLSFYQHLGFVAEGGVFLEEGLPHIFMKKTLQPES
jgi:ElaA protein